MLARQNPKDRIVVLSGNGVQCVIDNVRYCGASGRIEIKTHDGDSDQVADLEKSIEDLESQCKDAEKEASDHLDTILGLEKQIEELKTELEEAKEKNEG